MRRRLINPGHHKTRRVLRTVGPAVLLVGLILTGIGAGTVILGDPFRHPVMAAMAFVGMPLMFIGLVGTSMGFMGAVARYQAGEVAPVGTDTVNYMAEGSKEGVRTIASAIGEGLRGDEGKEEEEGEENEDPLTCPGCGAINDPGSRFCDQCGGAFPTSEVRCPGCDTVNDPDARFCSCCGGAIRPPSIDP